MTSTPSSPTTNGHTASGAGAAAEPRLQPMPAMPASPPLPQVRRARRPALLGLGVALVALGALGAVWLAAGSGDTVAVLAVAHPVEVGQVITADDLRPAQVAADPALRPIPEARRRLVVGRYAATDLVPGTLLTRDQVTDHAAPLPGFSLVGVAVKPTQLPDQPLRAGDKLLVVSTPPVDGDVDSDPPASVTATVVRVGAPDDTGVRVIDVTVPDPDAAELAARAATGRIALVLQPRHSQQGKQEEQGPQDQQGQQDSEQPGQSESGVRP